VTRSLRARQRGYRIVEEYTDRISGAKARRPGLDAMMQHTDTASRPSDLKITDLRVATVARAPMTCPVIRIDTNQGIYGLGEVRREWEHHDGEERRLVTE
jgi:hypothetical protein